jgi:hypothetical protein
MRVFNLVRCTVAGVAAFATGLAAAATILVTFPEYNGGAHPGDEPFPLPAVTIGSGTIVIPAGEQVVSAAISGFWGTKDDPDSTAGVNLLLDGVPVAQCVKPSTDCWIGDTGQRPWSHTFTAAELPALSDGSATLTAIQTSDLRIRLGVTTLTVETALPPAAVVTPPESVPTLGSFGMLALLAALAVAGAVALRRSPRA